MDEPSREDHASLLDPLARVGSAHLAAERVLLAATAAATGLWGPRLVASYALGSLVHGGFSAAVSDVDLAVLLASPLSPDDAARIAEVERRVKSEHGPLAERLSVVWGSEDLDDDHRRGVGRFPAPDRADLLEHGRLLAGTDVRAGIRMPTYEELVKDAASFTVTRLPPDFVAHVRSPELLCTASPKRVTKAVLFPVRFLYTLRTGKFACNREAAEYVGALGLGPVSELATRANAWRDAPLPSKEALFDLLSAGLHPLYALFGREYGTALVSMGEADLAERLREWVAHVVGRPSARALT